MRVTFHPAAADEFRAAAEYYDELLPGLGRRFYAAVRHAADLVAEYPDAGSPRAQTGARQLLVVGFPYDVVYWRRGEDVEILALAHHRRRPNYWRERRPG